MANGIALLVVDMQVCNLQGESPCAGAEDLLSTVETLISKARSADCPVIYVQHCGPEGGVDENGTAGWEIHPRVAPLEGEPVIQKRHPDAFQDTLLLDELENRGVRKLIAVGVQTEYCIDTTCRRGYGLGFGVTLAEDGHSTWDSTQLIARQIITHHNGVLGGWFAQVKPASEITFDGMV
jgi:nicotinamidase-related amidase